MIPDHQQGILRVFDLTQDAGHRVTRQDDEIHPGRLAIAPMKHPAPESFFPGRRKRHLGGTHIRFPTLLRFDRHGAPSDRLGPAQKLMGLVQDSEAPLGTVSRREELREAILAFRHKEAGDLAATDHGVGCQPQLRMGRRSPEKSAEHQQVGADLLRPPNDLYSGYPGAKLRPLGVHPRRIRSMHHPKDIETGPQISGKPPGDGNSMLPGARPVGGRQDMFPCHV